MKIEEYEKILTYKVDRKDKNYKSYIYEMRLKLETELTKVQTIIDTFDAADIPTIEELETEGYRLSEKGMMNLLNN